MREQCQSTKSNTIAYLILTLLFLFTAHKETIAQCTSGTFEGAVFSDENFDGSFNSSDVGLSNVLVRAFDSSGSVAGSATTDSNGNYSMSGLDDGDSYRIQIVQGNALFETYIGADNSSTIRFEEAPDCNVSFGLRETSSACTENPQILLTCFVQGDINEFTSYETIIGLEHDFSASSSVTAHATKAETGSIWGLAYRNSTHEVFSSAFVKQDAALTSHGHDAIFKTDLNTNTTSLFVKLSNLGVNTGALTVTDEQDCAYGAQVGKYGIGNIGFSNDQSTLYAINIFDNSLVEIDVDNPTASTTQIHSIPTPNCVGGNARAFALKVYNGSVFVGLTCDAGGVQDEQYSEFYVYEWKSGSFTQIFNTDYALGFWNDTPSDAIVISHWLTDIDFTDESNMLLAVTDRFGHRYCNGTNNRVDQQRPDLLTVWNDNGVWKLENNGTAGNLSGSGVNNGQGPGGGEFFADDFFPADPDYHSEVALGSILAVPGTGEVIASVFDPFFSTYSGGLHRYVTSNGKLSDFVELYTRNLEEYFGKATGFGEIIAICPKVSPEIGNYVWEDSNGDGIQDAGENPLGGVDLVLLDENCNEVANTTTNAEGQYSFNDGNVTGGLIAGQDYCIALDQSQFDANTGTFVIGGSNYTATIANQDPVLGSDLVRNADKCPQTGIQYVISTNVSTDSDVNHSFDIGLVQPTNFDLALMKTIGSTNPIGIGSIVQFDIYVMNQGDIAAASFEVTDYLGDNFGFDPANNQGWIEQGGNLIYQYDDGLAAGEEILIELFLEVLPSTNVNGYENIAEISSTIDQFGNPNSDLDSNADDDSGNDVGGNCGTSSDDQIDDDGTFDEDDHDVACIQILDLALLKDVNSSMSFQPGDQVTFDITVFNQGNIEVSNIDVVDYFPSDLAFSADDNPGWINAGEGMVVYEYDGTLLPGQTVSLSVTFTILSFDDSLEIVNAAEIVDFEGPVGLDDIDSNPDFDPDNDDVIDDEIDFDGKDDEDDHDIAIIGSAIIDVALMKTTDELLIQRGDEILFSLIVENQEDVIVYGLELVDYLPDNFTLADPNWSYEPGTHQAYQHIDYPDGLANGEKDTITIVLKLDEDASFMSYVNLAEINSVFDVNGNAIGNLDIDSTPDDDRDNEVWGLQYDDSVHALGDDDEDDHDGAPLFIVDFEVREACVCIGNGEFRDSLVITGPSNQQWFVDTTIGLEGITLVSEDDIGSGYSDYVFVGVHQDGAGYNVRFVNEFGFFIQHTNDGCSYDNVAIEGTSSEDNIYSACVSDTETYQVNISDDCTVNWSISGGGIIISSTTDDAVVVDWGGVVGSYELTADVACPGTCPRPTVITVNVGSAIGSIGCINDLNLSMNSDCCVEVTSEMILAGTPTSNAGYGVMVLDAHGNPVPNNKVTDQHIGEELTVKLIDACSGNSCWAFLFVEDKTPPTIQCDDITLDCTTINMYEPLVTDNCGEVVEVRMLEEVVIPNNDCDPNTSLYIKEVIRSYVAVDSYGNESAPCHQTIFVKRFDFDGLDTIPNFEVEDGTYLSCADAIYDENGLPDVEWTGVPTWNGFPIYPFPDLYCNVGVSHEDFILADEGCVQKYMRTWIFYEACGNVGAIDTITQRIEIMDQEPPVILCDDNIVITTSGETCDRNVFLPPPLSIEDDCTNAGGFIVNIRYPGGLLEDAEEGGFVTLPAGEHDITYIVYDGCLNEASCEVKVFIQDDTPPTAICDQFTVVSLRGNGTAEAWSKSLDDGSFDDCKLHTTLVRKMNPDEDVCPCDVPYFVDMDYLGERNGSYYYISKYEISSVKAYSYANAMGGHPAIILNEDEDEWIKLRADSLTGGARYYIGLNDVVTEGDLVWSDGTSLGYDNFSNNEPLTQLGDYVVVNTDGNWIVTSGNIEHFYVFETDDRCGWSEYVNFCCGEVGQEQMVQFRAVDYFGNTNECMVTVEVQDKTPPDLDCPDDVTILCDEPYSLDDLSQFGEPTASDSCFVNLVPLDPVITVDQCGVGVIKRRWRANDLNGAETCVQEIHIINPDPMDEDDIIWPEDFEVSDGCNSDTFDPENLPVENAYPIIDENFCDLIGVSFTDESFFFVGNDLDACFKIIRTWEVIDWCKVDTDDYIRNYQQSIKIDDIDAPEIVSGCDETDPICTFECDGGEITLTAEAKDSCTPDDMLNWFFQIDADSDGTIDVTSSGVGNQIDASGTYPIGNHTIIFTFEDGCGNMTSCTRRFTVENCKPPTAACIDGLSVGLEPMDLDGDGAPDTERACVEASFFDASSFHPCGFDVNFVFCDDPDNIDLDNTEMCFDCNTCGLIDVNICVVDPFGNVDFCVTTIEVQDNNEFDFCPDAEDCISAPADFTVPNCTTDFSPDNIGGAPTIDANCFCTDFIMDFQDVRPSYPNASCNFIVRTWTISPNCGCPSDPMVFTQNISVNNAVAPEIICPEDVGPISADGRDCEGFANVPVPTFDGICQSGVVITHDSEFANVAGGSNASGFYPVGTTTVRFEARNECGLASVCTVNVSVVDNTGPVCQTVNTDLKLNTLNVASIGIDQVINDLNDDCGPVTATFEDGSTTMNFICSDLGENTVTVIITDENMNTATCDATVNVTENIDPVCSLDDLTIVLNADESVTVTLDDLNFTSSDNCDRDLDIRGDLSYEFDCDDMGRNVITISVFDDSGNSSNCSAIVTVTDDVRPTCSVDDITVSVMGGSITLTEDMFNITSNDECGQVISEELNNTIVVDCDDVGSNVQAIITVTDDSGNTSTCAATVTVIDDNMPSCNFATGIELCLDENGMITITPELINPGGGTGSCGVGLNYDFEPDFFACNDMGTQTITVTVSDTAGNSCSDVVTVEVTDKIIPSFGLCPSDMTVTCAEDISNLDDFGTVTSLNVFDNCSSGAVIVNEMDPVFNTNDCNVGTITRTWVINDFSGNTNTCTQVVSIINSNPFSESNIQWPPANETVACSSTGFGTEPVINTANKDCTEVEVSFEDVRQQNDCELVIRTWTVIDRCLDRGDNVFTFTQNIRVVDNENPTIEMDAIRPITVADDQCLGQFSFEVEIADDCTTAEALTITNDYPGDPLVLNNNGNGVYTFTGFACSGVTNFSITVTDGCGKSTTENISLTANGGNCFELNCTKVNATLNANGSAVVNANDLLAMDNMVLCSYRDLQASFSPDDIVPETTITCDDLNPADDGNIALEVYFFIDGVFFSQPSCSEFNRPVVVFINFGEVCENSVQSGGVIAGRIQNPLNNPLDNVMVELEGSNLDEIMTGDEGDYAFPPMPIGGSYRVVPTKDIDPLNGVSTLDLILIQQHILDEVPFDSPYKYIAADINRSRSVTSLDIIELRKLILGNYDNFPDNTSWRMIDSSYEFEEDENPFDQPIPDEYNIYNLEGNMEIDFVGIKVGDINYSATAGLNESIIEERSSELMKIIYQEGSFQKGELVEIPLHATGFTGLEGAQYALELNSDYLQIRDVAFTNPSLINESNISQAKWEEGIIPTSWHFGEKMEEAGNIDLMTITAYAVSSGSLSEALSFNEEQLTSEGYVNHRVVDITLLSSESDENDLLILNQNNPNPWSEKTLIDFYSNKEQTVIFNVFDINGKLLMSNNMLAEQGTNNIYLHKSDFQSTGVLYYELVTENQRITKKMLLLQ